MNTNSTDLMMVPLTTKGKPDKSLHVLGTAMKRRKSRHHNGLVDENGMITSGQGIYCFDAGVEYLSLIHI